MNVTRHSRTTSMRAHQIRRILMVVVRPNASGQTLIIDNLLSRRMLSFFYISSALLRSGDKLAENMIHNRVCMLRFVILFNAYGLPCMNEGNNGKFSVCFYWRPLSAGKILLFFFQRFYALSSCKQVIQIIKIKLFLVKRRFNSDPHLTSIILKVRHDKFFKKIFFLIFLFLFYKYVPVVMASQQTTSHVYTRARSNNNSAILDERKGKEQIIDHPSH